MKAILTWRQFAGTCALLFVFDVAQLSLQMLREGGQRPLSAIDTEYFTSIALVFIQDVGFVALVLSAISLVVALREVVGRWVDSSGWATWLITVAVAVPFGVVLSAGRGLAKLAPRWVSLTLITGAMAAALLAGWWGSRWLLKWLRGKDSAQRSATRVGLLVIVMGLFWADAYLLRGLYPAAHFLCSALAVLTGALALTYHGNARSMGPLWQFGIAGVGLGAVVLSTTYVPLAHTRAVLSAVGARQNAQIASQLTALWPRKSPGVAPTVATSAQGSGLVLSGDRSPHVFIVSIDGVRSSHVGFLGATRNTTPFLDRLAERSIVYERAYSPASNTMNTINGVLTNATMEPVGGPADSEFDHYCPSKLPAETLPLAFAKAGYYTVCDFPYARRELSCAAIGCRLRLDSRDRDQSFNLLLQSLSTTSAPVFGFIHLLETHAPYRGYDRDVVEQTPGWSRYERSLRGMDQAVRGFYERINAISQRPVLWVITSDHGEALGEHGHGTHGTSLYEEQVRVPLLIHSAQISGSARIDTPVSTQWLHSSLLPIVNRPVGRESLPLESDEAVSPPVFLHNKSWFGVVEGPWKYFEVRDLGARHLYHLKQDPDELTNLLAKHPERARRLEQLVDAHFPE